MGTNAINEKRRKTPARLTALLIAAVFVVGTFFIPTGIYAEDTPADVDPAAAVTDAAQTEGAEEELQNDAEAGTEEPAPAAEQDAELPDSDEGGKAVAGSSAEDLLIVKDEAGKTIGLEDLDENAYDGFIYKLEEDTAKKEIREMENAIDELEADPAGGKVEEVIDNELYTADSLEAIDEVADADMIEYVEPDYLATLKTNDYYYDRTNLDGDKYSWYLDMIKAPYIWDKGVFGEGAVVGVIDTGVMMDHPDLDSVEFIAPYDAVEDTEELTDTDGHGTAMAGIIAGAYNNEEGLTGIMPEAKIIPVNVFKRNSAKHSHIAAGIRHAAEHGADVLSMSLGDFNSTTTLKDACDWAASRGVILLAASGNEAEEGNPPEYPACYSSVVSVGAVNQYGSHSAFSNYNNSVDVVAPGERIACPYVLRGKPVYFTFDYLKHYEYDGMDGTSAATPQVAAMAAMIKSMDKSINCAKFKSILSATCIDKGTAGRDNYYGYGLMDLSRAYRYMTGDISLYTASISTASYVFNGANKSPAVTVKNVNKTLKPGVDFKAIYPASRKAVGTYTVTVQGIGNYTGTQSFKYKIMPPLVKKLKSPKRYKRKLMVRWNTMSKSQKAKYRKGISGYQVRVSKYKSLKKAKYVKVAGYAKTSATVKGLKRKTTYYMQYRSYKKVGKTIYYSKWSAKKKTKTK